MGIIFEGVTTSPARDFIASLAARQPHSRYLFPLAGRFTVIAAALARGVPRASVRASDLSLFSSIVGYLADPTKKLASLKINFVGRGEQFAEGARDDFDRGAAAMLAIAYAKLAVKSIHASEIQADLLHSRKAILKKLRDRLQATVERLRGITYDIADVRDVVSDAKPDDWLYLNVTTRRRPDHSKVLAWADPGMPGLDPKGALSLVGDCPATTVLHVHNGLKHRPPGWPVLMGEVLGKERTDYVVANRPYTDRHAESYFDPEKLRKFPIYNEEEITENSVLTVLRVDRETCLYYRDLFVHRLGMTDTRRYFLLAVDGRVMTSFGIHDGFFLTGSLAYLYQSFGITISSNRYARLGKLFMLMLTSGDFKRYLMRESRMYQMKELRGMRTTSIAQHDEAKTDRSIMKFLSREQLEDGQFRIVYQADFREKETFGDVVKTWLRRWGNKSRVSHGGSNVGPGERPTNLEGQA